MSKRKIHTAEEYILNIACHGIYLHGELSIICSSGGEKWHG
jgi:hypothetical protein